MKKEKQGSCIKIFKNIAFVGAAICYIRCLPYLII